MTLWAKSCSAAANNSLARNTETASHAADAVYGALPLHEGGLSCFSESIGCKKELPHVTKARNKNAVDAPFKCGHWPHRDARGFILPVQDNFLGPKFSAKERRQVKLSRTYAISQVEYCFNYIFKRNFPIHKLFERSCELGLWRLTAHKIAEVFGTRLHRNHRGKLSTIIHQIEHGHHVYRTYFKNAILRQYEKFLIFLRNELCSNNLYDFGLHKGLDHMRARTPQLRAMFLELSKNWEKIAVQLEEAFKLVESEVIQSNVRETVNETKRLSNSPFITVRSLS